jgi:hypothetical protein
MWRRKVRVKLLLKGGGWNLKVSMTIIQEAGNWRIALEPKQTSLKGAVRLSTYLYCTIIANVEHTSGFIVSHPPRNHRHDAELILKIPIVAAFRSFRQLRNRNAFIPHSSAKSKYLVVKKNYKAWVLFWRQSSRQCNKGGAVAINIIEIINIIEVYTIAFEWNIES